MIPEEREFTLATYAAYPTETLVYRPAHIDEPLDLATILPGNHPLEVELGAGDGSFLLAYAAIHPDRRFIAVERLLGRLRKIDKQARRRNLGNICCLRLQSEYVIRHLIPPGHVTAVHIYFPDPWPKAKHERNRLIRPQVVQDLLHLLPSNATVYLRTDNIPYFEIMKEVFGGFPDFKSCATPEALKAVTTDFERHFNNQGIPTNYLAYQKQNNPA